MYKVKNTYHTQIEKQTIHNNNIINYKKRTTCQMFYYIICRNEHIFYAL